jgi:hypothetical protein
MTIPSLALLKGKAVRVIAPAARRVTACVSSKEFLQAALALAAHPVTQRAARGLITLAPVHLRWLAAGVGLAAHILQQRSQSSVIHDIDAHHAE